MPAFDPRSGQAGALQEKSNMEKVQPAAGRRPGARELLGCIFAFLFMFCWVLALRGTKAVYSAYLLCFGLGCLSLIFGLLRPAERLAGREHAGLWILAVLLSACVLAANYELVTAHSGPTRLLFSVLLAVSGVVLFYVALRRAYECFRGFRFVPRSVTKRGSTAAFFIPFVLIAGIDLFYLFLAAYPGNVTVDGLTQLGQVQTGHYSDWHPFYHTMLVRFFYELGMAWFHSVNAAVATYLTAQCLALAAIFAYGVMTLYELGVRRWALVLVTALYALLPYHWSYAATLWKDVLFGGTALLLVISLFRYRRGIGRQWGNAGLLFLSSLGFCLLRNNGVYAFALTLLFLLIYCLKTKRLRLLALTAAAFACALVLKGPVMARMNVETTPFTEALSIPLQQVARTLADGKALSPEDTELISRVVDISAVPAAYNPRLADPVKNLVTAGGGDKIISAERGEYLRAYLRIGRRYPAEYLAAWIDQTCGYWNAGYYYWISRDLIDENSLGLVRAHPDSAASRLSGQILNSEFLLHCGFIGLCAWCFLVLFAFCLMARRGGWLETVPPLAVLLSLLAATPVFCEFRYAYALFTALPFVLVSAVVGGASDAGAEPNHAGDVPEKC